MITEPTRTCNTRQSLLDPVLVSDNCNVLESSILFSGDIIEFQFKEGIQSLQVSKSAFR
jgi:hypothetical protein